MRLPTKPPLSLKHREERLKLGATALQNFALALSLGVLVIPALTGQKMAPIQALTVAFVTAGIAEFLAFTLLRYIPSQPSP